MSDKPTYTPEQAKRGADALAAWVNPTWRIGWADQAARVVLNAALGTPGCLACTGWTNDSGKSPVHAAGCPFDKGSSEVAGQDE